MPYDLISPVSAQVLPSTGLGAPVADSGMNLRQLREELSEQLGGRDDLPTERLNLWVNWGYADICSMVQIEELKGSLVFSTIALQNQYLLPPEVINTEQAAISSTIWGLTRSLSLDKRSLAWYRMQKEDTPGFPNRITHSYFREGRVLVLYPTPRLVLSVAVDVRVRPQPLVSDLDCPVIPFEWHQGIVLAAREAAFGALLEFDKKGLAQNDKVSFIRSRLNTENIERKHAIASVSIPRSRSDLRGGPMEDDNGIW